MDQTDYEWFYASIIEPLTPFIKYLAGDMHKKELVQCLIRSFDDEHLEGLLVLLSDIRLDRQQNPLSKYRQERPEQMEFVNSLYRITIALCGNRWGKTIAMMWHLCSTATGQNPHSKHQPDPSRPLRVWVIGESWTVLNDTILKEIKELLREDQYTMKKVNSFVESIIIRAPNGGETHVRFIPSGEDEEQKFESAALHYVYVDEGIRAALFRQIIFRIGDSDGQLFQAFTRLPENMHLADYLIDLEDGEGEFAELLKRGYIKIISGATYQNIYTTREDIDFLEASVHGNEQLRQARLYGKIDKPKGSVFNFRKTINVGGKELPYNVFSFTEFYRIASVEPGRWDLIHDYGQAAPAFWGLCWTSRVTGTTYIIDEIHEAGMSIEESAQKCYDMIMRWECYFDLNQCFADKQIMDRGKRNNRNDIEITTYQQYRDKYADNGDPCFPKQMKWVCKQADKNNRMYTINLLQELIEQENPLTPGLPYIRVSVRCKKLMKELRFLRWYQVKKHTENVKREITEGEDHGIDPLRYFINNKINHTLWRDRKKLRKKTNEMKFLAGGSKVPFFNI
jgi:hypothetical protein